MYKKAFELSYKNKKVEIEIQDFVGTVRNINGTEDLFSLSYISDSKDKGQSILVTEADINFYADDYFNIDELKTVGETDIKVKYYEDGVLLWSGFVIPDFFSTSVDITPVISMVATDRIGTLKEISNNAESNIPIQILASCLKQTGQDLPINIIADNNHFETPIQLERIEDIASYDVIRSFMVLFNCKITLYKNAWWVINKKLLETGFVNYKSYNSNGVGGSVTPFAQPILDIDLVDRDGQREIKPTASEISLFLEFGGSKKYPDNWNFEKWNGDTFDDWTAKNGFIPKLNTKQITGYTLEGDVGADGGYYKAIYGADILDKSLYIKTSGDDGNWFGNYYTKPHLESEAEKIPFKEDFVDVTININFTTASTRALRVIPLIRKININPSQHEYFVIQNSGEITRVGIGSIDLDGIVSLIIDDSSDGSNLLEAVQSNWEKTFRVETSKIGTNRDNPNADIRLLIFEPRLNHFSKSDVDVFVHSAQFIFNKNEHTGKGLIFKTKQGGEKFSKSRDPETILFSDKINQGVNGYFYNYKYDDTSIVDLPSEFALTSVRERADMFSKARDYYSLDGNFIVNPLAKYVCGLKSFVLVGGENRREDAGIIVEEIVSNTLNRTDFIYTYFDDGKDKVKSIGTASGGSSSDGGGGGSAIDANSHTHPNKIILDTITQEMLDNALREMLGVESTEEITDENYFSALRTIAEIVNNNEVLKGLFISKVNPDTAQEKITFEKGLTAEQLAKFLEGIEIGDYTQGFLGSGGIFKMKDGISELEVDKLTVRMMATFFEIVVSKISHIGGQLLLTPARMKCIRVEELPSVYRCYFDKGENGEAVNEFQVGDQARCQVFTGSGTKFYWRLVTAIGTDYIELSKTDKLGDSAPEIGDDIIQLGNRTNQERRNAIILSTVGDDAPSWKQYEGINSFSLEGKATTIFSSKGNRIQGKTVFVGDREETLDDWAAQTEEVIEDIVAVKDTRITNQPPEWYYTNYPKTTVKELKYCSVIGIIGEDLYCTLESVVRGADSSVGAVIQTATTDSGKQFVRSGEVGWTQWRSDQISIEHIEAITDNFTTFQGGLITPVTIALREAETYDVTAGMSGIQGEDEEKPAFWAGGTYDGAKDNTAKSIIRHDGSSKFTDTEIEGRITATSGSFKGKIDSSEGNLGGMTIAGDMLESQNGRVVVDGVNNAIYLLDENGSIRTAIRPDDLPDLASYFASSVSKEINVAPIIGDYSIISPTKMTSSVLLPSGFYEAIIPEMTLQVSAESTSPLGGGASMKLELVSGNGVIAIGSVTAWTTGGISDSQSKVIPKRTISLNKSGEYYLKATLAIDFLIGSHISVSGEVIGSGNLVIDQLVNRSEIGNNGMMIATSKTRYDYMVGGTSEVRRGDYIFRVTEDGIEKSSDGGNSWNFL